MGWASTGGVSTRRTYVAGGGIRPGSLFRHDPGTKSSHRPNEAWALPELCSPRGRPTPGSLRLASLSHRAVEGVRRAAGELGDDLRGRPGPRPRLDQPPE